MDGLEPADAFSNENVGAEVQDKFFQFLEDFIPPSDGVSMSQASAGSNNDEPAKYFYVNQLVTMREAEKTTLYVDWDHLLFADTEFGQLIRDQYLRVDPFLRKVSVTLALDVSPPHLSNSNHTRIDLAIKFS